MPIMSVLLSLIVLVGAVSTSCRALQGPAVVDRRQAVVGASTSACSSFLTSSLLLPSLALADDDVAGVPFESRNRNGNKEALIRDDYWYMMGKTPPRKLTSLAPNDPKWNAWGSCQTDSGNSCTYVPLKQRIPAYSKYAFNIALGAKEYQQVGNVLKLVGSSSSENDESASWDNAAALVDRNESPPPPAVDALLKMILFASAMLTTPNYTGPPRDLLVARFYVNEANFATTQVQKAIMQKDVNRAMEAWEFGKDSWNSYLNIVNPSISPKVGEPIPLIQ